MKHSSSASLLAFSVSITLLASTLSAQRFREYTLPAGSGPTSITIAADGTPWFTETTANKIGYINGLGILGQKTIPTANSAPWGITAQGNTAFFTEANTGYIGYVSMGTAVMEAAASGIFLTTPHDIVYAGSSGFWVTGNGGNQIVFIDRLQCLGLSCGFMTLVAMPPTPNAGPEALSVGPDGSMWFTELNSGKIGVATRTYSIATSSFSVSATEQPAVTSQPQGIALGPDGAIWFTEKGTNKIGHMNASGTMLNEFTIPTPNSQPHSIVAGPRGYLYFTEEAGNKIGRIRGDGTINEFPIPTPNSGPTGIAVDGYGTVWFTEKAASKIGSMSSVVGDENADGNLDVLDLMYLINYFFASGAAPL